MNGPAFVYGRWYAYRLSNGHGQRSGKWSVFRQSEPRADLEILRNPSGAEVTYETKEGAEKRAEAENK